MACPYFDPLEPIESGGRIPLPLGEAYAGVCRAAETPWTPDAPSLRRLCNLGYAADCPRWPGDGGPDAVRFAIASDSGGLIRVACVLERDHLPFAHGRLEYDTASGGFRDARWDGLVERQARAYVASYLRRRSGRNA